MKNLLFPIVLFLLLFPLAGNSQSIQSIVTGKGEPVILLPGFASTSDVWATISEDLLNNHELHLIDYAGFGKVPAVKKDFLEIVKTDLKNYVSDLDAENLTIIGHSMGGTLAAWLAAQSDLSIKQIIVIDGLPATGALMFPGTDLSTLVYDSPYNKQMREMDSTSFAQTVGYMSAGMATDPEYQEIIKRDIIRTDRTTYVNGYTDYLKFDIRKDLANIKIPILILGAAGMYGVEAAEKTFEEQYSQLKDFDLYIHPTAKHFIMYDDPAWLSEKIATTLKS
jgi:pimeloyl-ACP methyl ester carboxylesterase